MTVKENMIRKRGRKLHEVLLSEVAPKPSPLIIAPIQFQMSFILEMINVTNTQVIYYNYGQFGRRGGVRL